MARRRADPHDGRLRLPLPLLVGQQGIQVVAG